MKRLSLVLMVALLAAVVATPVQALPQLDSMDNIAARPWTDARDPGEGTGWLMQNSTNFVEGTGSMEIDYGVTNDSAGVPDPTSGWNYLGAWVGVGGAGGAFDSTGAYKGKYDREIGGTYVLGVGDGLMPNLAPLVSTHEFTIDVYKSVTGYGEHLREIQLYDSGGLRNTYNVTPEGGADPGPQGYGYSIMNTSQGWTTYVVPLSAALDNFADLTDIVEVRLFVSAWAAYAPGPNPYTPGTPEYDLWPDWGQGDWNATPTSGTPVLIDNFELVPEPATIAMLSLGGLALLRRRKKA